MVDIEKACDSARYSENLQAVLEKLGAVEILRLDYESGYQGHVDADVLLGDGRVFSYHYYYGSCSGCDEWEDRNLAGEEIEAVMMQECTIFDTKAQWVDWREMVESKSGS